MRRSRKEKLTVRGVSGTGPQLCKHFGIVSYRTALSRVSRNPAMSWEDAVTRPSRKKRNSPNMEKPL